MPCLMTIRPNILTSGGMAVGGAAIGEIDTAGDRDWFAVELVAGRTCTIDLRGSPTGDGTLKSRNQLMWP